MYWFARVVNSNLCQLPHPLNLFPLSQLQEATDKKVVELKTELDAVKRDLEEMVEARERQKVLVDSIIGQRDSYRYMLAQINGTDLSALDQSGKTTMESTRRVLGHSLVCSLARSLICLL